MNKIRGATPPGTIAKPWQMVKIGSRKTIKEL